MDALNLLTHRHSHKKLTAPAPTPEQLVTIFQAALRVPDHGNLKPYRFYVLQGQSLLDLEADLLACCDELQLEEKFYDKARSLAHTAPMIIVVTAQVIADHKKVPVWEQLLTAGAATYAIQLACQALGYDNCWITGKWTQGSLLRAKFGCQQEQDQIVAFLLVGTAVPHKEKDKDHSVRESQKLLKYVTIVPPQA